MSEEVSRTSSRTFLYEVEPRHSRLVSSPPSAFVSASLMSACFERNSHAPSVDGRGRSSLVSVSLSVSLSARNLRREGQRSLTHMDKLPGLFCHPSEPLGWASDWRARCLFSCVRRSTLRRRRGGLDVLARCLEGTLICFKVTGVPSRWERRREAAIDCGLRAKVLASPRKKQRDLNPLTQLGVRFTSNQWSVPGITLDPKSTTSVFGVGFRFVDQRDDVSPLSLGQNGQTGTCSF